MHNVIHELLGRAKEIAREYYELTGKPLGITGEVAEYEAARILGLTLTEARQPGYDAVKKDGTRVQIKGRRQPRPTGRVGKVNPDHEWDTAVLVLLDEQFDAISIYEAEREAVIKVLDEPGSKARNERGSMSISKFKSIGTLVWSVNK